MEQTLSAAEALEDADLPGEDGEGREGIGEPAAADWGLLLVVWADSLAPAAGGTRRRSDGRGNGV